jgi:pyridoxamine 5'-phosphate oxidase
MSSTPRPLASRVGDVRPLSTLAEWVEDARDAGLPEHDAVALATTGASGRPTARIVSVRRVEATAVVFTTALWTRKARDLRHNPHVALLFHWQSLGRQVHVGGRAEIAERALAEEIFAERDRPHQLQSMASRQGEPIADLAALRERLTLVREEIGDGPVPCPDDWAAVRVRAEFVEYWSASPDALHDRVVFERDADVWRTLRLAP